MSAARLGRKHCVYCRQRAEDVGGLSTKGACRRCGTEAMVSALIQQQVKSGPLYERAVRRRTEAGLRELSRSSQPVAA